MSDFWRTNGDSLQVKTFFVANMPEGCKYEILWSIFRSIGRTVDIFIPRKHGKDGRRFIFIRYVDVKDEAAENRADFGKPITTNIIRQNRRVLRTNSSNPAISSSKIGIRKTYVEAVKSMPDKCSSRLQPLGGKMKMEANLVFDVKQCSTSSVYSIGLVPKLQELLGSKITEKCLVRPIGGCKVLLSPERGYNLKDFIESECVPWWKWFLVIRPWMKIDVGTEYATWYCLKERFNVARTLISTPCYEVIKEDIRVAVEEDTFLINVMEDSGGDGGDGITQGGEESNSLKLASDQSSSAIDRGICSSPLEAISQLNDELNLPANGESGSLNRLFDPNLGRSEFHDDLGRSHTDSSIAIGPFILAHLANMGDETTIYSLGPSEVPFTQGPIHSLEFQAYGTHRGKKKLRKVKKKTLELIEEDPISASEGIDLSMALATDSQIANVNKRVVVMREERKVEKIWDFLT
ncbi:hypothetical protein Ancab_034112 [Ancistrocladus abbreviatus]